MRNEHLIEEANRLKADERNRTAARAAAEAARVQRIEELGLKRSKQVKDTKPTPAPRRRPAPAPNSVVQAPESPETPVIQAVIDDQPIIDQTPTETIASETLTPDE
jgi:hypothetical protein